MVDVPDVLPLPERSLSLGVIFSGAFFALAANASIVLGLFAGLDTVSAMARQSVKVLTYALMTPTMPAWQCFPCEQ